MPFPPDELFDTLPPEKMPLSPATNKPASGYTHPLEGTRINDRYLLPLNDQQGADLLDLIIHEGVHWMLPPLDRRQDDANGGGYPYKEAARRTTKKLIKRYNRERKERCGCE